MAQIRLLHWALFVKTHVAVVDPLELAVHSPTGGNVHGCPKSSEHPTKPMVKASGARKESIFTDGRCIKTPRK